MVQGKGLHRQLVRDVPRRDRPSQPRDLRGEPRQGSRHVRQPLRFGVRVRGLVRQPRVPFGHGALHLLEEHSEEMIN